jgi:hypothetical protein
MRSVLFSQILKPCISDVGGRSGYLDSLISGGGPDIARLAGWIGSVRRNPASFSLQTDGQKVRLT